MKQAFQIIASYRNKYLAAIKKLVEKPGKSKRWRNIFTLLLAFSLCYSCNKKTIIPILLEEQTAIIEDDSIPEYFDFVTGDFNGDGVLDSAWVVAPKVLEDSMDCIGACVSYIRFSDSNLPPIIQENSIGGHVFNEGDLNANGTDEIGFIPEWFTGNWHAYHVWTWVIDKWIYAVDPISVFIPDLDEEHWPIKRDSKKKGYVIITKAGFDDEGVVHKSKSVLVRK
jgi:hypothetical protein